jgi:thioesterase domain-containing protein
MVPDAVVVMVALPVTANGKLDRKALPEPEWPRANPAGFHAAPRTALQTRLSELWREVLGLSRPVGLHEGFFELGGHSLLGIQLLAKVGAAFDVELPTRALFEAQTVAAMAELIAGLRGVASATSEAHPAGRRLRSSVIPMKTTGRNPPFFCVAPGSGAVFPYFHLASMLGPDQPFYGLEDPRAASPNVRMAGIEDLAAYHVEALREVQARGPFLLGGWCVGGLVAFEMARQLTGAGERVALLALFDCSLATPKTKLSRVPQEIAFALSQVRASVPFIRDNLYLRVSRARARARARARTRGSRVSFWDSMWSKAADKVYTRLLERIDVPYLPSSEEYLAQLDIPAAGRVLAAMSATAEDLARYVAKPYRGRVTLFWPGSGLTAGEAGDATSEWRAHASAVDVRTIPGNHVSIFTLPHIRVLASELRECLAAARRE